MTPLPSPLTPLRIPAMTSGLRFPSRPPLRFPVTPIPGTIGFLGLRYNPFFYGLGFPGCNPFVGLGFGCGLLSPYYGYGGGYIPAIYPSQPAYPSEPPYPSDPVYSSSDSSAALQYTPLLSQSQSIGGLAAEELIGPGSVSAQFREETMLYLKDGSVFTVSSYTVTNGLLQYVTAYGQRNDLSVDLLDLQKTIEANAARGVAFTLTPPDSSLPRDSKPIPLGPAPAPEGPITPPKP